MFTKVLVPLDQSSLSEQAIGPAVAIAQASGAEIDLVLAHKMIPLAGYLDVSVSDVKDPEQHVYLAREDPGDRRAHSRDRARRRRDRLADRRDLSARSRRQRGSHRHDVAWTNGRPPSVARKRRRRRAP